MIAENLGGVYPRPRRRARTPAKYWYTYASLLTAVESRRPQSCAMAVQEPSDAKFNDGPSLLSATEC